MKKTVLVMIVLSLAIGIPNIAKSNSDEFVVWQIGKIDGEDYPNDPIGGSYEFPATDSFVGQAVYTIGTDEDEINFPSIPGYLAPAKLCTIAPRERCTDATPELVIKFVPECDYEAGELTLVYGRFGAEAEDVYFPGGSRKVSGTEGEYERFEFPLGAVSSGVTHEVRIILEYPGGDGHYIDYIQLVSSSRCLVPVEVDIKPGSCPNPLNVKSKGVLPVALLGTEDFDVRDVDVATLSLKGIPPIRSAFEDVATALAPLEDKEECYLDCNDLGPDEFEDLTLKFYRQDIITALGEVEDGQCRTLSLTGELYDGTPIEGEDVILILGKPNVESKQEKKEKKEKK